MMTKELEKIFERILEECFSCGFVDDSTAFIDATHIKAAANNKKFIKKEAERTARFYEAALKEEINRDREAHDKKPLKDKDDDGNPSSGKPEKTV